MANEGFIEIDESGIVVHDTSKLNFYCKNLYDTQSCTLCQIFRSNAEEMERVSVSACLKDGGLMVYTTDSKYINLRFRRRETQVASLLEFDEFINLRDYNAFLESDEYYRFDSAILYLGGFHYMAVVRDHVTGCFVRCNDSSCTRKGKFEKIWNDDTRRQVTNVQYVKVTKDMNSPLTISLPKQLAWEQLQNSKGFKADTLKSVKVVFDNLLTDYKPVKKKRQNSKSLN